MKVSNRFNKISFWRGEVVETLKGGHIFPQSFLSRKKYWKSVKTSLRGRLEKELYNDLRFLGYYPAITIQVQA